MDKPIVYILAGGLGSRLAGKVENLPKVLAPVGDKPFLDWQFEWLKQHGLKNVVLCVGHKRQLIMDRYGNGEGWGMSIHYSIEETLLGTGGAFIQALKQYPTTYFVLINGDTYFRINLSWLTKQRRFMNKCVTVGLKYQQNTKRYGRVVIDHNYGVEQFIEKGRAEVEGYINGGIYVGDSTCFKNIGPGVRSLEQEFIPTMMADRTLKGVPFGERFIDIGVPEDYRKAKHLIPKWSQEKQKRALFLDRDGVLVHDLGHGTHLKKDDLYPDTIDFLHAVTDFKLFIVSNQAAIAKGLASVEDIEKANTFLVSELKKNAVVIDGVYICPYHEQGTVLVYRRRSLDRKPEPGMLLKAAEDYGIDLYHSVMIGDQDTDVIRLPYVRTYLILRDYKITKKSAVVTFERLKKLVEPMNTSG